MKVAVGLSGGVDSSVAAYLLQKAGYEVVGVTMKIWDGKSNPDLKNNACYGADEPSHIRDASELCALLGIPFHVIDCSSHYNEIVLRYFKEEYGSGRTPNPCIRCNEKIKFDVLPMLLEKSGVFFNRFATGHYARIDFDRQKARYLLKKGKDPQKDQSYFLYRLSQKQLIRVMFPLGDYTKEQVRSIARDAKLPMYDKKDSQDFCGSDYTKLLPMKNSSGNIIDMNGNILGRHTGIWNFTIGQRKGLGVAGGVPLYVVAIDPRKNEVVLGARENLLAHGLRAVDCNIIGSRIPDRAFVKIRSSSTAVPCAVSFDGIELAVTFDEPQLAVTPGQSAVVYHEDNIVIGGVIAAQDQAIA